MHIPINYLACSGLSWYMRRMLYGLGKGIMERLDRVTQPLPSEIVFHCPPKVDEYSLFS